MLRLLFTKIQVPPHSIGLLYHNHSFQKVIPSGIYRFLDPVFQKKKKVYLVPEYELWTTVSNQEVLSQDNIAFRFSFHVSYLCSDPKKFIEAVGTQGVYDTGVQNAAFFGYHTANSIVAMQAQVVIRDILASMDSAGINEQRMTLLQGAEEALKPLLEPYGLSVKQLLLRDLSFPKKIQDLFALELEAKIRAKADLENARTRVAAARALKNAGDMVADNRGIQLLQYLETISKISSTGKHTFIIGDTLSSPLNIRE